MEPRQPQFLHTQGPVARKKSRNATQILRAVNPIPGQRGNPRKWGPGGKRSYGHEVPVGRVPRRRFGDFAAAGKVTRRPQAAKPPCKERNFSIIAPSSVTASPCHLPPKGKAFPSSGPFGATFPPRGRLCGGGPRGTFPRWEGLKNETGAPGRPFSRGRLIALIGDTNCWSDTGARR